MLECYHSTDGLFFGVGVHLYFSGGGGGGGGGVGTSFILHERMHTLTEHDDLTSFHSLFIRSCTACTRIRTDTTTSQKLTRPTF